MLLTLKFSRQQEHEADAAGLERLRMARVDAAGFQQFFSRAEKMPSPPEIISNHPSNEQRAELAARFKGYPVEPLMNSMEWGYLRIFVSRFPVCPWESKQEKVASPGAAPWDNLRLPPQP